MMDLTTAMRILEKEFPNKRVRGNPAECHGKYTFNMVDKDCTEAEAYWDACIIAIDKITGDISQLNLFGDYDYLKDAKPINQ